MMQPPVGVMGGGFIGNGAIGGGGAFNNGGINPYATLGNPNMMQPPAGMMGGGNGGIGNGSVGAGNMASNALFNTLASTEGNNAQLSLPELSAAISAYAGPTGTFNLDSFLNFSSVFGLNRQQGVQAYANLAASNNGQVTAAQLARGALTLGDQNNGTWNAAQFGNVANAFMQLGSPPANPVQSTFNLLSGGRPALSREQLTSALTTIARGNYFTPNEFSDFTTLLGIPPQQSAQIYQSFAALTQGQPTVQNLASIAALVADQQNGSWTAQSFQNAVGLIGQLPQYQQRAAAGGGNLSPMGGLQPNPYVMNPAQPNPLQPSPMGGLGLPRPLLS